MSNDLLCSLQPLPSTMSSALQPQTQWTSLQDLNQIAVLLLFYVFNFLTSMTKSTPFKQSSESPSPTSCELPLITHPLDSLNLICEKRRCLTFPLQLRLWPTIVQRTNNFEPGPSCRLGSTGKNRELVSPGSPGLSPAGSWNSCDDTHTGFIRREGWMRTVACRTQNVFHSSTSGPELYLRQPRLRYKTAWKSWASETWVNSSEWMLASFTPIHLSSFTLPYYLLKWTSINILEMMDR